MQPATKEEMVDKLRYDLAGKIAGYSRELTFREKEINEIKDYMLKLRIQKLEAEQEIHNLEKLSAPVQQK